MVASEGSTPSTRRSARRDLLLAVPASLFLLATILVIDRTTVWGTTYSGSSIPALAADLAAGVGLLVAGALSVGEPTTRRVGWLLLLSGVAWFASDWVGWQGGHPLLRSLAVGVQPLLAPLLACAVALPLVERAEGRRLQVVVWLAVGVALLLSVALALVDDPRLDPTCWSNCTDNAFLVAARPALASALRAACTIGGIFSGALLAWVAIRRVREASKAGRRLLIPIAAPAAAAGAVLIVRGVLVLFRPMQDPRGLPDAAVFVVLGWCVAGLGAGFAWRALRAAHVERLVAEAVQRLPATGAPGSMAAAIGTAAGDPALALLYRLGPPAHWVDDAGASTAEPESDSRRVVAPLTTLDGSVVAALVHDQEIMEAGSIARRLGAAGRLAIDNERLQIEVGERLEHVRESRARIVRTTDDQRRRLERDLHDGAQQRLLALTYDLRLARAAALRDGGANLVSRLDGSIDAVRAAHKDLRDLAHGLFPAVLAEAGLAPALQTLADRVPLVIDLHVEAGRVEQDFEFAVYAVVREALEDAVTREATQASVTMTIHPPDTELVLTDDGAPLRSVPAHLADRVGAAGGSLRIDDESGMNQLHVRLPCG